MTFFGMKEKQPEKIEKKEDPKSRAEENDVVTSLLFQRKLFPAEECGGGEPDRKVGRR